MTENIEKKSAPQNEVDAPTDRKRIALLNGVCGQADRLRICGQVVDIPITEEQKAEAWDPFHGLPNSLVPSIRPMQDFTMRTVRRARLQLELLDVHPTRFRQNRQEEYPIIYSSEVFTSNDDSFFAHSIDAEVPPGQYVVRVILRGIDSIRQSAADLAYIRNSDSLILKKDIPIGYGRVVVLPRSYTGFILTSDIDQTFLDTPLHSSQGLMETLFQTPEAKPAIPGLPEFYRQVQRMHDTRVPTMFISASPHFFRRTLSAVFDHYDIDITGLHLKYLMSTVDNILKKFGETIFNLNDFLSQGISHSVERTLKFLGSSFQSLFDQIAYKTITLLENRQMQPTEAREILMGDNTEGDYFIFTLYQFLLKGELTGRDLENYLYRLNFLDREALTRDHARRIVSLTEANLETHGPFNPVAHVWIHRSNPDVDQERMEELINNTLPDRLHERYEANDPDIIHPLACKHGGAGFALAAWDEGLINEERLKPILHSMIGLYYKEEKIDDRRLKRWIKEYPFRHNRSLSPAGLCDAVFN